MKKRSESSVRGARAVKKGRATTSRKLDFTEIPELSDRQLAGMRRVGRPPLGQEPRKLVAIRMDARVLEWLRQTAREKGVPYQSLINDLLADQMRKAG
jgi:uncharacterized protein (DUF4415 family)